MANIQELQYRLEKVGEVLQIAQKKEELVVLEAQTLAENFWDDQERAVRILAKYNRLKDLTTLYSDLNELLTLSGTNDPTEDYEKEINKLEIFALFSASTDVNNCIITIHAGTGGVDAQDWAEMLQRMYIRYIQQGETELEEVRLFSIDRSKWRAEVVELNRGEEAGIKKVVIEVSGEYAYGLLKAEAGVHRLVRLSPFNAKNLRQTSFALIEVIPEIEQDDTVIIDEKDLRIDVYRSGGHGGQGVNTTDSAVRITHIPSGIVVAVQNERSQHQNKATALKILRSRLQSLLDAKNTDEQSLLKGEVKEGSWGNQIRSYVMQPYQMVKDHRTGFETSDVNGVLDGNIGPFIHSYLTKTDGLDSIENS